MWSTTIAYRGSVWPNADVADAKRNGCEHQGYAQATDDGVPLGKVTPGSPHAPQRLVGHMQTSNGCPEEGRDGKRHPGLGTRKRSVSGSPTEPYGIINGGHDTDPR